MSHHSLNLTHCHCHPEHKKIDNHKLKNNNSVSLKKVEKGVNEY